MQKRSMLETKESFKTTLQLNWIVQLKKHCRFQRTPRIKILRKKKEGITRIDKKGSDGTKKEIEEKYKNDLKNDDKVTQRQ